MLPFDDGVLCEVRDVRHTGPSARLEEHPADVGKEKAFVGVVRVELGVCVAMVSTMATTPPLYGALNCTGSKDRQEVLEWQ